MTSDHSGGGGAQRPKVDGPKLKDGSTEASWRTFIQDWECYKESLDITAIKMIRSELLSCCTKQVWDGCHAVRGPGIKDIENEVDLLAWMKSPQRGSTAVQVGCPLAPADAGGEVGELAQLAVQMGWMTVA